MTNNSVLSESWANNSSDWQSVLSFTAIQIVSTVLHVVAILTTLLNVLIFSSSRLKDSVYKYLMVASVSDHAFLISSLVVMLFDIVCDPSPARCGSRGQQIEKIAFIWIGWFLGGTLIFYGILNEIFIATQRLLILKGVLFAKDWKVWHVGPALAFISFLINMPYLLVYTVQETGSIELNGQSYLVYSIVDIPSVSSIYSTVKLLLGAFIVTIGMTGLNIATLISLNTFLKIRFNRLSVLRFLGPEGKLINDYRVNGIIALMLLSNSTLIIIGTLPYQVYLIIKYLSSTPTSDLFASIVYTCVIAKIGLKALVFYSSNRDYRRVLHRYLRTVFMCKRLTKK